MDEPEANIAQIRSLIDTFQRNVANYKRSSSTYNETELRNDFLNPLLTALGWDVYNSAGAPHHLREVVHEDTVEIESDDDQIVLSKKPDYALRVAGERKFFIEAKKPSVDIENSKSAAYQVRRYGWNARLPVSILTNFDKLVIYDCRFKPDVNDDPHVARIATIKFSEYLGKYDQLELFSRQAVYSGAFDEKYNPEQLIQVGEPFDEYFLQQIEKWRLALATNLHGRNPRLSSEEINYLVQLLINRIVFLRICEDRNLESYENLKHARNYEDLKSLFAAADIKYNSGLFNLDEDRLSAAVKINDEVIVGIFQELYFPQSPYAFSVVEPSLLGDIYERFISRQMLITESGGVSIVEKPEVVESRGVVATPKYVVDEIVETTLAPLCQSKRPQEIIKLKIADIACGSGVFLLAAYQYLLNFCLEWYIKDGPEKHQDQVYEGGNNQFYLTLDEKQKILINCIFGVDIDPQAVEVAKFSLLLKVIEEESSSSIDTRLRTTRKQGLPNIDTNIVCGNSIVDEKYYSFDPEAVTDEEKAERINPFVWETAFPEIMERGGFDAIIGNPPYIRIQNMVRYSPDEVEYYKSPISEYQTSQTDNFDKYSLFIERGIELLNEKGNLCFIVPNKFLTTKYGTTLRSFISTGRHLCKIIHFGVNQVFGKKRITYTCILSLCKTGRPSFTVEHVASLPEWKYNRTSSNRVYSASSIDEKPWVFVPSEAEAVFTRLETTNPKVLEDFADIFVGLQTSNDSIYIIKPLREEEETVIFKDKNGREWTIEKAILRSCYLDVPFGSYDTPRANTYIIFPYKIVKVVRGRREVEQAQLYSPEEMEESYGLCWEYLNEYKSLLKKRSIQGVTDETWYRFGRSQSLTKFDGSPNLIWPVISLEPRYAYDPSNTCFTGGGNGPYYGLRLKHGQQISLHYIQALLYHPVIEAWIRSRASKFQQDYGSHGKQFIINIPIFDIDLSNPDQKRAHDEIAQAVEKVINLNQKLLVTTIPQRANVLKRQIEALKTSIESRVSSLYGLGAADIKAVETLLAHPE